MQTRRLSMSSNVESVGWLDYSKSAFKSWSPLSRRIDLLVSTLETNLDDRNSRLLVIGPRFECELYGYLSLGIKKKNLEALDTFSYSPLIQTGNMHSLEQYGDNYFDIVIMGWTIVYSENPKKVFSELSRITNKSGKIILTWDSPKPLAATDGMKFIFENTLGTAHEISNYIDNHQIISWGVTRPNYNSDIQVITLVIRP
jgi:SAM-dependent methyltransferase